MEILTNCPACKGTDFRTALLCKDYIVSHETFTIMRCNFCGFRFTNPRPGENEKEKYYESEEYISHTGTSKGIVNKIYGMVRNYTIRQKVKLINKQVKSQKPDTKNILDIGTGTGEFLNACKKNGWNVSGIEPSLTARGIAKRKFGMDLHPSLFSLLQGKKTGAGHFNVITLWHVLEHIHTLDKTIEQIKTLLAESGALIVAVPNCNSPDAEKYGHFWAAWDVPRHLYHFTLKDIQAVFSNYGFKLKEVLPMKWDAYYISLLSEKYKTGKQNLFTGFLNGFLSNIYARKKNYGYSSQIYILNHIV